MPILVFDPETGICLKEIGGAAIVRSGEVGVERPQEFDGVHLKLLRWIGGDVRRIDPTPEQIAAQEEGKIKEGLLRILLEDRFEQENRLRVLESKAPITRAQFIDALKARFGM